MPLNYPDLLQHNNSNYALIKATELRGTAYNLTSADQTGSIPADKRQLGTIIYDSKNKQYLGFSGPNTSSAEWNKAENWYRFSAGSVSGSSTVPGYPLLTVSEYGYKAFSVNLATTASLSAVYGNGVSGVGAFLSGSSDGALGLIDGNSVALSDRILVKDQSNPIYNGIYTVISTGSVSSRFILSRSIDADASEDFDPQVVIASEGSTNRGIPYGQRVSTPEIGVDPIQYAPQTSNFVTQTTVDTQNQFQIPWWTKVNKELSRGVPEFTYTYNPGAPPKIPTVSVLRITGSLIVSGSAGSPMIQSVGSGHLISYNTSSGLFSYVPDIPTPYVIPAATETGSIPGDRRKLGMIVYASSSQAYYGYVGSTTSSADWDVSSSWKEFQTGAPGVTIPGTTVNISGYGSRVITVKAASVNPFSGPSGLYNNGPNNDGIGAFISGSVTGSWNGGATVSGSNAPQPIDNVFVQPGDLILVKNQGGAGLVANGVYVVNSTGSNPVGPTPGTKFLLTRYEFADESDDFDPQVVIASQGSSNKGIPWGQQTSNPVIGTDPITYASQVSNTMTQTTTGTQRIYQIPWWTSAVRDLSRGAPELTYTYVSSSAQTRSELRLTGSLFISSSRSSFISSSVGSGHVLTYHTASGLVSFTSSLSVVPPGGSNGNVQYNSNGVFAGDSGFKYESGTKSVAIGTTAKAGANSSLSVGNNTHANAPYSIAVGDEASISSNASLGGSAAIGIYVSASGSGQTVVGQYNATGDTTSRFIVGNGPNLSERVDAFKVTNANTVILPMTASGGTPVDTPGYDGEFQFGTDSNGNYVIWVYLGGAWRSGSLV